MNKFSYAAIEVQQRPDGRRFYLIEAPAAEILEWAGVPIGKRDFEPGYQWKIDDRHEGIRDYLRHDPNNIIPSAVLIAANRNYEISDYSIDAGLGAVKVPGIKRVTFSVPSELDSSQQLRNATEELISRLSPAERTYVASGTPTSLEADDDENSDDESPLPPESYVAVIAREMQEAVVDPASVSPDRMKILLEYASMMQLPGMILDGQHRVYGAKLVNAFDVHLPVVLLTATTVAEQAFQFYVVNNKATKLTPTELRGTISTSLTAQEISSLYERFRQAGVSADTARWTHQANNAEGSPFLGLIDFGFQKGFLKENVMFQVMTQFMRPARSLRSVFQSVPEWNDPDGDTFRMQMFFTFWITIRDQYKDAWNGAVANRGGQLLMKATMLTLQKYVFGRFAADMPKRQRKGEKSPVSSAEELSRSVADELYHLPEEFFTRRWTRTDIDTSDGRSMLHEQITKVIQGLGRNVANFQLFKQSKSDAAS
jgi:hypothetical protein